MSNSYKYKKKTKKKRELRDYQKECLACIPEKGSYLIQMATGLGKTFTFCSLPRRGRMLILAHREELVHQPKEYFKCPVGIEMASEHSHGEEIVIASVQSLVRRLNKFKPDDFDILITDEAHHAAAPSYKKIYAYFKPRLHLGFTATPNRGDKVRLDDVYEKIIFERDLKWGILNGYLSNIYCLRVNIGYDISKVRRRMGDFALNELENKMNIKRLNKAIAKAYDRYAVGQTLIFATSIAHAEAIAREIPQAVALTSKNAQDRRRIINAFTNRKIPVIVSCSMLTEGTDLPLVETIMIARPTANESLYCQIVGRGLRLYKGKEKLTLIDLVGITGKLNLCTAPSLLGLDMTSVPKSQQNSIQGDLFSLEEQINSKSDCIDSWINNVTIVKLWGKEQGYDLYNINFYKHANGSLSVSLPHTSSLYIKAPDELGNTRFMGEYMPMQDAICKLYKILVAEYSDERNLWDLNRVKKWGNDKATDSQIWLIKKLMGKSLSTDEEKRLSSITKLEASCVINRLKCER